MDIEEDIFFDMDTAITLWVIANELISNSLKHAFPNGKQREIRVILKRIENLTAGDESFELDNNYKGNNFCYVLKWQIMEKGFQKKYIYKMQRPLDSSL